MEKKKKAKVEKQLEENKEHVQSSQIEKKES